MPIYVPTPVYPNQYKMPANALASTIQREYAATASALTSGTLSLFGIEIRAGTVVSNLNIQVGGTAMAGGTHHWFTLHDSARVLLARSADLTTATQSATSTWTKVIGQVAAGAASSYTVPTSALYYLGVMIAATTMPTLMAVTTTTNSLAPILAGTSNTGQTTAPAFAFTATALTAAAPYIYGWVS